MSELEDLSRKVEESNARALRAADLAEITRVEGIVTEARERILAAVDGARYAGSMHAFVAHVNPDDHPGCQRCSWPKDHVVHGGGS